MYNRMTRKYCLEQITSILRPRCLLKYFINLDRELPIPIYYRAINSIPALTALCTP